jgi:hypothetical protein
VGADKHWARRARSAPQQPILEQREQRTCEDAREEATGVGGDVSDETAARARHSQHEQPQR